MMEIKDVLNGLTFLLTIIIVLFGLTKGFDILELSINLMYFSVLVITQLINVLEIFRRDE